MRSRSQASICWASASSATRVTAARRGNSVMNLPSWRKLKTPASGRKTQPFKTALRYGKTAETSAENAARALRVSAFGLHSGANSWYLNSRSSIKPVPPGPRGLPARDSQEWDASLPVFYASATCAVLASQAVTSGTEGTRPVHFTSPLMRTAGVNMIRCLAISLRSLIWVTVASRLSVRTACWTACMVAWQRWHPGPKISIVIMLSPPLLEDERPGKPAADGAEDNDRPDVRDGLFRPEHAADRQPVGQAEPGPRQQQRQRRPLPHAQAQQRVHERRLGHGR